jgi:hypothetical protein
MNVISPLRMPCELSRVCLALSGGEFGLFRGQPRVLQLCEELSGHLVRPRSPQMSVYGPRPRTPSSLDRHIEHEIPTERAGET